MTRRRYIQINGELVEVTNDDRQLSNDSGALWGDRSYDGLRAPDGTDISSRSKHRDYMRATGLTTADDFKSDWGKAQQARDHYRQHGGSVSRADIARAMEKLRG